MPDKDPSVKDQVSEDAGAKMPQRMRDFIVKLRGEIQRDDDDRSQWKDKMIAAANQRLGVKRYTENPYPGAPDIPLPETDKLIKKQVPNLVLSAWSPKTMCSVSVKEGYEPNPDWDERAKRAQLAMNAVLRSDSLGWFKKLLLAADYGKQHGHCLFRVREEFKSRIVHKVIDLGEYPEEEIQKLKEATADELRFFVADRFGLDQEDEDDARAIDDAYNQFRAGEEVIEFDYEEIESFPNVDVPLPTKVIVPAYATDITRTPRLTFEYFLSLPEIEGFMRKNIFEERDLSSLSLSASDDDIVEQQKRVNEGVTDNTSSKELFRVHEVYTYYREEEKGELKRKLFVFLADVGDPETATLKADDFPYEFEGWNWEKWDNEVKDERYYSSRGLPEQVRAYQDVMERAINNMLIRDEQVNNPMWEVLSTSDILDQSVRFVPGQKLPVKSLGSEIQQVGGGQIPDVSSANILQLVKAYVEEYQSSNDYLFRNATNAGGGKTLGEISVGMQMNSQPLNLEVISWNETLSRVYTKMFYIMKERMGDSMWVDGVEITREDFNFPAEVKSNGDLEVANQNLLVQKAAMRLQVLMNPSLSDIVDSEDRWNALKDWLEKDGVKDPDLFCTDPAEIAKSQLAQLQQVIGQLKQQMEQAAKGGQKGPSESISFKDLPPEGQVQMAAQAGITLTPETMARKQAMDQAASAPIERGGAQ